MNQSGPNPTEPPDSDLAKEVYAHFGLCMYLAQVFETGLINILTMLQRAKLRDSSPETFDRLYRANEALTFGNLMKTLEKFHFLPKELANEILRLKSKKDRLAHRYFRDHDLDFVTTRGWGWTPQLSTKHLPKRKPKCMQKRWRGIKRRPAKTALRGMIV